MGPVRVAGPYREKREKGRGPEWSVGSCPMTTTVSRDR